MPLINLKHRRKKKELRPFDERKAELLGAAQNIPLSDVVNTLCELLSCNTTKQIRDRIDYAIKTEEFEVTGGFRNKKFVNREKFLQWAVRKWPELHLKLSLPIVGVLNVSMPSLAVKAYGVMIPTDNDELIRQYVEAKTTVMQQEEEISACHAKIKALEEELTSCKLHRAEISRKCSENGKKGGRRNDV